MTKAEIVLIVAAAENGVIGCDGAMPWRLPSDLKRFKALTFGKPVLMGRKTCHAIGRPLPGRTNIVLTRDAAFCAAGVIATTSFDDAIKIATGDALRRGVDQIAVIGGAEIYALAMPQARMVELTRVHATPDGDAHFNALDPAAWERVNSKPHEAGEGDSAAFTYETYRRIAAH